MELFEYTFLILIPVKTILLRYLGRELQGNQFKIEKNLKCKVVYIMKYFGWDSHVIKIFKNFKFKKSNEKPQM